jgi:hypothetical protein
VTVTPHAGPADLYERHFIDHPEILEALDVVHQRAWATVEPRLLELCRLRVAGLLGAETEADATLVSLDLFEALPQWPTSTRFDATDRACLAFTEQWVIDVASIPDECAAAVVEHLGPEGALNFTHALLVVEQRLRLRSMWRTLFADDPQDRTTEGSAT